MTGNGDDVACGLCGESQAAIRASQRTDDPLYCFDGDAEYPTHRFTNRVPSGAAVTGWKRRGAASSHATA
ncbi:hypothetical protein [Curtobacterium sp. MCSS17_016]|uniref:hypothetical protein n=1 Tax=Curtobacterium sp. MCSS17_016 TaxID=2175644 RepID=UPI000DA827AB|nr:hypothetical protein [Curtobacterium sp. MCSS17_016]WIE81365.1 hypothetical protein DEJ19_019210 [Curtobacterium sp. MCSS17_016]